MKLKFIYTLILCTTLAFGCSEEKTEKEVPSAEKMSLKVKEATTKVAKTNNDETKDGQQEEVITDNSEKQTNQKVKNATEKSITADYDAAISSSGRAYITFAQDSYFFGEIEEGDLVKHTFKFKNDGDGTLIIKDATATCGCTRPDFPFVPILPGETGDINVVFNSTGKVGPQKKAVTIFSNGQPRVKKVFLEGTVLAKKAKTQEEVAEPKIQADTTSN
ncbi:MAG: DUF1573 domain-containing protein [Saprospiraceae bacterium]